MTTLAKVEDDRDELMRASRDALWLLAKRHGVTDKFPDGHNTMHSDPTNLGRPNMVAILRSLGIRGPRNDRILGTQGTEVTVASDILPKPVIIDNTPKPVVPLQPGPSRLDLKAKCQELGIEVKVTDNSRTLLKKLRVHGQNSA